MCCHLSFVFENRNISANSSEFQVHVSLCQRVLGIYSKSARSPPPSISEIDWNEFLCRIFLGICDEVMRGPADSRSLGNDIEQDVFFCMFDIWLRSQMQNETLWNTLLSMASKEWIHRRWFIESWGQCCVALTRKLINVLYGNNNGADAVFVFWPVLGTNVISIDAMLAGRGSMIAMSKYSKSSTSPKSDSNNNTLKAFPNHNYEVRPNRFGSRSVSGPPPSSLSSSSHHNSNNNNGTDINGLNSNNGLVSSSKHLKASQSSNTGDSRSKGPLSMATYIQIEDNRLLIYLWNQMLHLLDINAINDPECFGCGIAWISRMVDMFLGITIKCKQRKNGILSANGNSILDIFSHELFTAAVNMNGFEEARAIALGGLCRIFVNKCDTIFKSEYLLNFYHTLHELLRNPNAIEETAREQVILNGATLFACDFDGCRALITIFLPHIGIILRKPQKPRLRLAAITMLCSFISLEWHFYNSEINASPTRLTQANSNDGSSGFALKSKDQIIPKQQLPKLRERLKLISNIIYDAIQTETNEYNLQKLLWCCSVFLIISSKYISKSQPFSSSLVRTIWKHIEEEAGHWPCHVITTAFKALTHVIEHVVYLDNLRNDSVLNWRMFIEMCQYAKIHLEPGTQFDIDSRRVLSVACMKCLLIWLKNDSSLIVSNVQVSKALRELIRHAIKIKANRGQSISSSSINNNSGGGGGGGGNSPHSHHDLRGNLPHSNTDYDYSGNEPPPLWETMKFTSQKNNENTNALKDVYRATDQLARFFTNDIGSYYQYRKQSICNSPMHRYAEAYLNEQQIEDYIWKSLHGNNLSDKWQSNDRIRYFAYKKNRIITLIEMPRFHQLQNSKQTHSKAAQIPPSQQELDDLNEAKTSSSATNKIANKSNRQRHALQHLEPRHCDVIILVRDAYGKYAWEASGIFNDYDQDKEIKEIIKTTSHIIDNSKVVATGKRNQFGSIRQDMIARSLEKSQILAQQKNYHHNQQEESKQNDNDNDNDKDTDNNNDNKASYEKLVSSKLVPKNNSKSSAAYWSSAYVQSNWRHNQENDSSNNRLTKLMKSAITSQKNIESKTNLLYSQYQRHPLKNMEYQQQQTENKSNSSQTTLDESVAYHDTIDKYSESSPPKLPTQDDAATFMHSRRLLSTLGFLRPNQATGVARFVDILDNDQRTGNSDITLTDYLNDLDQITALDQIAISILYHNDGETQLSDFDILSSPKSRQAQHSQSFEYFLTSMANRVAIKTHVGFKANLTNKDCDKFPYYSDSISGELAYIVPSEIKDTVSIERRKTLYLSSCIRIIWSETESTKKNCPLWLSQDFVPTERHPSQDTPIIYIRITAQSHGLYRVSINGESVLPHLLGSYKKKKKNKRHSKNSTKKSKTTMLNHNQNNDDNDNQIISVIGAAHTNTTSIPTTGFERVIIGPLVDGMVISESVLPDLVRKTIVNASNLISDLMEDSLSVNAKEKRERTILEISTKFEKYRTSNRDKYYEYFFVNPDDTNNNNNNDNNNNNKR